jgi:hypothetical protein
MITTTTLINAPHYLLGEELRLVYKDVHEIRKFRAVETLVHHASMQLPDVAT